MKNLGLIKLAIGILPSLKGWIFADGKFKPIRALILLASFIVLLFSINYFGAAEVEIALDMLDEVSDIIGYAE